MKTNIVATIGRHTTRQLFYHFPSRASEWAAAFITLNWGLLALNTEGKVIENSAPQLLNFLSPMIWGVIFFLMGAVRLAILIINGALRRSPHLRSASAFVGCFLWFQITMAFLNGVEITTALAVYPVLLAIDFYNAYRIAIEARITDEGFKNAEPASAPE